MQGWRSWLVAKARNDPADEPTLIGSAIALWLSWRLWGAFLVVLGFLSLLVNFTGLSNDALVGWMLGFFAALIADGVMDD